MTEQAPEPKKTPGIVSKALRFVSYPLSGFVGYWVTRNHIRHSQFTKLREEGALDDIIDPYKEKKKNVYDRLANAETKAEKKALHEESAKLSHKYTADIRARFEELGLDTLRAQSKDIYKQQTHKAMIEGATALSIMLGGLLILSETKSVSGMFKHDDDKGKTP